MNLIKTRNKYKCKSYYILYTGLKGRVQRANKTINTKVGRASQRQITLNEGKTLVNTEGVYGSKFGNETHFLSFAAIVATRNRA